MEKLRKILCEHPFWSSFLTLLVTYFFIYRLKIWSSNNLNLYTIREVTVGGIVLFIIYIIAGKSQIAFSLRGIKFGLRLSWWPLLISLLASLGAFLGVVLGLFTFEDNLIFIIIEVLTFCLFIGF